MDLYELLGIERSASQEEIKRAYFRMVRKHTPEHDPEMFMRIRDAYEILSDATQRKDYDESLSRFTDIPDEVIAVILESERLISKDLKLDAIRLLESKKYSDPKASTIVKHALCNAYIAFDKLGKALNIIDEHLLFNPEDIDFLRLAMKIYTMRGWTKKAEACRNEIERLDPGDEDNALSLFGGEMPEISALGEIVENIESHGNKAPMICFKIVSRCFELIHEGDDTQHYTQMSLLSPEDSKKLPWHDLQFAAEKLAEHTVNISGNKREVILIVLEKNILPQMYYHDRYDILPHIDQIIRNINKEEIFQSSKYETVFAGYLALTAVQSGIPKTLAALPLMRALAMSEFCSTRDLIDYQNEADCLELDIIIEYPRFKPDLQRFKDDFKALYSYAAKFFETLQRYNDKQRFNEIERRVIKVSNIKDRFTLDWLGEDDKENLFISNMPIRVEKIGRNEPCPCGSGKKYKKCCGAGA